MKQDRQFHLKLSMLQYKFSMSKHNFKPMHINLSYPYRGTAVQIKKKHLLLMQINNTHMIFLLQIDRYASLDHDFNIKYFLINSNTNIRKITISVTMLTLAVPCYLSNLQN